MGKDKPQWARTKSRSPNLPSRRAPASTPPLRRRLAWLAADGSHGYALQYPDITLHAVCRDAAAYPAPCIFAQLAAPLPADDEGDDAGAAAEEHARTAAARGAGGGAVDLMAVDELRLEPPAAAAAAAAGAASSSSSAAAAPAGDLLERLFEAISACQELHPDPGMALDDDDDEGGDDEDGGMAGFSGFLGGLGGGYSVIGGGDGGQAPALSVEALAQLHRLEGMLPDEAGGGSGGDDGDGDAGNASSEAGAGGAGAAPAPGAQPGQFDDA